MNIPSVVHPKVFEIAGMYFQIVSYSAISDTDAQNLAMAFYRTHKFKKSARGKTFKVMTTVDKDR
ncbi:MAG: hypothetical protein HQM10_03810 [Candidatus Riflebacteria bacterium]|nr:hypothetical protein [Candidatus Riflebacteria bacterium]